MSYAGARGYGQSRSKGKPPVGWTAASSTNKAVEEMPTEEWADWATEGDKERWSRNAVADRAGDGAEPPVSKLPFMCEFVYMQPVNNKQTAYVRNRIQPDEAERPKWIKGP
mmetsp:Transcript_20743/g.42613  ORF Transcript_20743/g.42613 Transcript_20743/m.42613 type:complete len:111 (+) Transcript_20743:84-416(+)